MIPAKFIWKPLVQKMVTGHWQRFHMSPDMPPFPERLKRAGLYLHVPFCKNLCPFCPYNRFKYDEKLFDLYEHAVHQEIDLYAPHLKDMKFTSLYVGGGTPTVNLEGLLRIIEHLRSTFSLSCDICIELHPNNMDNDCLAALKDIGVTMLSIGVESATDHILKNIGRNHDGETALNALRRAIAMEFDAVNADLMFALPGQTLGDWDKDLRAVLEEGIDQISTYPMFSFPYSELGKIQRLKNVERPTSQAVRHYTTSLRWVRAECCFDDRITFLCQHIRCQCLYPCTSEKKANSTLHACKSPAGNGILALLACLRITN